MKAKPTTTEYFSPDYFTARRRFRQAVEEAGGHLTALEPDVQGPGGESLSIDIAWFGSPNPRHALLHTSGVHGVEGFTGSAIQLQFLDQLPSVPRDAAIVLVHILNPWGMVWLRRFNENNVDLNRNFLGEGEEYAGAPERYDKFDRFFNPPSPPSRDFFYLKALCLTARWGMPKLKQLAAGGQYEYPKGLFFGGRRLQTGPRVYQSFLADNLGSAERIVAIDVHTGLGKFGEDTLLVEQEKCNTLRKLFGERVAPMSQGQGCAFGIRGVHNSALARVVPNAKVHFVCQEFGTYNPMRVLHSLREENRWHQYGRSGVDHSTKKALQETFNPAETSWRCAVLTRGGEMLKTATRAAFETEEIQ